MWWLEVPEFYVDHNRTSKFWIFVWDGISENPKLTEKIFGIGSDLHNKKTWCCKQSEWWWCFDLGNERKTGIVTAIHQTWDWTKNISGKSELDRPKKGIWPKETAMDLSKTRYFTSRWCGEKKNCGKHQRRLKNLILDLHQKTPEKR
jgi:hypothetical protein